MTPQQVIDHLATVCIRNEDGSLNLGTHEVEMISKAATPRPAEDVPIVPGLTHRKAGKNANGTPLTSTGYAIIDPDGYTFAEFRGFDSFQGSYLEHVPVAASWIRSNRI
jgi:hypothetical protein